VFLKVAYWFINDDVLSLLGDYLSICPDPPHDDKVPELDSVLLLGS
jgi:hypothetical protein